MTLKMRNPLFGLFLFGLFFILSCSKDGGGIGSVSELADYSGISGSKSATGSSGSSSSSGTGQDSTKVQKAGIITAAEWKDIENWSFWQTIRPYLDSTQYEKTWGFTVKNHTTLTLSDVQGQALIDAQIIVKDGNTVVWEAKTDNKGRAELMPTLFGTTASRLTISALYNDKIHDLGNYSPANDLTLTKQITVARQVPQNVDVMFVVDATGSMGDELEYLKTELTDVISRIQNQSGQISLNLGSVIYRDRGDEYVTRVKGFGNNMADLVSFVKQQKADGGGDLPEAVEVGLEDALKQSWRPQALARILFIVLDAPPHPEQQDIKQRLETITRMSAKQGIKIVPIFASSTAKETEFLMRFMAMGTNGTYVFITDDSGIGNSHVKPTIGKYKVEYLNDLMVRLMKEFTSY
jgi:von Willebrand factor type A domain